MPGASSSGVHQGLHVLQAVRISVFEAESANSPAQTLRCRAEVVTAAHAWRLRLSCFFVPSFAALHFGSLQPLEIVKKWRQSCCSAGFLVVAGQAERLSFSRHGESLPALRARKYFRSDHQQLQRSLRSQWQAAYHCCSRERRVLEPENRLAGGISFPRPSRVATTLPILCPALCIGPGLQHAPSPHITSLLLPPLKDY